MNWSILLRWFLGWFFLLFHRRVIILKCLNSLDIRIHLWRVLILYAFGFYWLLSILFVFDGWRIVVVNNLNIKTWNVTLYTLSILNRCLNLTLHFLHAFWLFSWFQRALVGILNLVYSPRRFGLNNWQTTLLRNLLFYRFTLRARSLCDCWQRSWKTCFLFFERLNIRVWVFIFVHDVFLSWSSTVLNWLRFDYFFLFIYQHLNQNLLLVFNWV